MPGMTAHVALLDIGRPQPGETVVVSAASGRGGLGRRPDCQDQGLPGCPPPNCGARNGQGQTVLREVLLVADHNAYHLGQHVTIRRLLGAWHDEA